MIARNISEKIGLSRTALLLLEMIAVVFFIANPFAYERMMVQPTIYAGIIGLGYGIYFLFFTQKYIFAWLSLGIAWAWFPHASFMIALILALYILSFVRSRNDIRHIVYICIALVVLNLNWLIAPLFGQVSSLGSISTFSPSNFEAFRTQALAPLDVISTNLLLYGFWGERYGNHFARIDILSSLWYIAGYALVFLAWLWHLLLWKYGKRREVSIVLIVGLIALLLGIGKASSLTAPLTDMLIAYIPLFAGYREPQKWIWLLMIVEGIGLIVSLSYFLQKYMKDRFVMISLALATLLLLLIWSPGPFLSYHGQLRTTTYPLSYETTRSSLLAESPPPRILVLPWHLYIGCSWIARPTIGNPVWGLLAPLDVTVSDNIEVSHILYSNSLEKRSKDIESFLSSHDEKLLQPYGYTHILVMKQCSGASDLDWLSTVPLCTHESEDEFVSLYKCHL